MANSWDLIQVMLVEYKTLRSEVENMQNRQKHNITQGLIILGGLFLFVSGSWDFPFNHLVSICLLALIPLCCSTIILTAAGTVARGRQILHYIYQLEKKINSILDCERLESNSIKALNFTNWYFCDIRKPGRSALKFDLLTMLIFFFAVIFISIALGCMYLSTYYGDVMGYNYLMPCLFFDGIIFISYSLSVIRALEYAREIADKIAADDELVPDTIHEPTVDGGVL